MNGKERHGFINWSVMEIIIIVKITTRFFFLNSSGLLVSFADVRVLLASPAF